MTVFECPVGAAADAKELEYIAALQQTDHSKMEEFTDASIEAVDIKFFLMSRYGIKVSEDQIRNGILFGLGGGDSEDDCVDLVEVVAMLLIPFLLKVSQASEETEQPKRSREDFMSRWDYHSYLRHEKEIEELKPPPTIISDVLKIILLDATDSDKPQKLTKELLRSIFAAYDEVELVQNDSIIEHMIEAATGGDPDGVLDTEAFTRALTSDVHLYDTDNEKRVSTHFEDVFGAKAKTFVDGEDVSSNVSSSETRDRSSVYSEREEESWDENEMADSTEMKTPPMAFTFPEIDFTAETFRGRVHVIIVWISLIVGYFKYFFAEGQGNIQVCDSDSMGCVIGQGIFNWTVIMGVLCVMGSAYVMILSFGNNIFRCTIFDIFVGVCGIGLFFFVPFFYQFDGHFFNTIHYGSEAPYQVFLRIMHLTLGCMLLVLQLMNVVRMFVLPRKLLSSGKLSAFFTGGNAYAEFRIKRAAVFKMNQMVKHAYALHQVESNQGSNLGPDTCVATKSTNSLALLNFTKISEKTETAGGFVWAWKNFWSGNLSGREGIWIHTRLIAANCAQLIITVFVLFLASFVGRQLIGSFYPSESADEPLEDSIVCGTFDPNNCLYPSSSDGDMFAGIAVCSEVSFKGDRCNEILWEAANEEEQVEEACETLSALAGETFECSALDGVPQLYYPDDTVYSVSRNSTDEDNCVAAVSVCLPSVSGDGGVQEGFCILGMDAFSSLPFQFFGDKCDDIPKLRDVFLDGQEINKKLDAAKETADESVDSLAPEKWMVQLSLAVGILAAFFSGMFLSLSYIPSTVSTILRFRAGVIPSLRDPNFKKYRGTLEDVTYLLGLIFWGVVFSSLSCIVIFVGATFFIVWQVTRPIFLRILAIVIGIGVTLVFKSIVIAVLGKVNYAAFYRKRPVVANVAGLALECWHLGLTSGYMLARTVKLFVCAALFAGRVDRPFLADGVGQIGPVNLDKFPLIFRKDLLSADAHRHPYIERLGVLYMLKLRYGNQFGKQPNSIWRLLFVFALMPWLRKYRILGDADLPDGALLQKLALKSEQEPSESSDHDSRVAELEAENKALRKELEELKQLKEMELKAVEIRP